MTWNWPWNSCSASANPNATGASRTAASWREPLSPYTVISLSAHRWRDGAPPPPPYPPALKKLSFPFWLLLDSRVVDVPMVYHPTFVMLYSLKSFFVNGLKNESLFSDNVGASDPGIQQERRSHSARLTMYCSL